MAARNPPWVRDELILALDLYFRHRPDGIGQNHPEVVALSDLLNGLELHPVRPDEAVFRNPNGVYMKMCNFLALDPDYKGRGLAAGGVADRRVWKEFSGKRSELGRLAGAIRKAAGIGFKSARDEEEDEFPEGKVIYRLHRSRERNPELVKKKKAKVKEQTGRLACQACGFDFAAAYGPLGDGYIECHHVTPLSELSEGSKVRLKDLAVLCSNCHRMIHRRRPWLSVEDLKDLLQD